MSVSAESFGFVAELVRDQSAIQLHPGKEYLVESRLLPLARAIAERHGYTVLDMRWIKPLDTNLLMREAATADLIVTLEEGATAGGAGSAVAEWLTAENLVKPLLIFGLPDYFVEHASRTQQLAEVGLTEAAMEQAILTRLSELGLTVPRAMAAESNS